MKEYIEREAVHSIIERTSTFAFTRGGMHEQIDLLPFADVAPVRHGHWINISPYQCEAGYKKGQQCSECYAYYVSDGAVPWSNHKYCAECGAKMDRAVEWESEQP